MRFRLNPALATGLVLAAFLLGLVAFAPWIAPYDPDAVSLQDSLQGPSRAHWFGTDDLGRDVFSRVVHAARIDLQIAFVCVMLPFVLGSLLGAIAGYFGGIVDALIMRLVDVMWAFPFYVLVIAIVGLLGPGERNMYLAFTLVVWISFARIVRGEVLVIRSAEYVQAARALGYSAPRIVLRHLLPNAIMPAVIFAMSDVVLTILAVTSLSFLGLGIQPPTAEWGLMIAEGRNFIFDAWWVTAFPGLAIVLTGIAFQLIGDGLDDLLRPGGS